MQLFEHVYVRQKAENELKYKDSNRKNDIQKLKPYFEKVKEIKLEIISDLSNHN